MVAPTKPPRRARARSSPPLDRARCGPDAHPVLAWLHGSTRPDRRPRVVYEDLRRVLEAAGVADVAAFQGLDDAARLRLCTECPLVTRLRGGRLAHLLRLLTHGRPALLARVRARGDFHPDRIPRAHLDGYLGRVLPGVSPEQRAVVLALLLALPLEVYQRARLREVCDVAARLPPLADLAALDHAELRAVTGSPLVRGGYLRWAKRQPALDPGGRFASHLHQASRATMDAVPGLWRFPVLLARGLERHCDLRCPTARDDARRAVDLAEAIAAAREAALFGRGRLRERLREAVAHDVVVLVSCLHDAAPPRYLGDVLPTPCTLAHIVDLAAHVQARLFARLRATPPREVAAGYVHDAVTRLLRGAIRNGVFEPAVRCGEAIRGRDLRARMRALEAEDPRRWRSEPPPRAERVPEGGLTEDDVGRLLEASRRLGPRHELIVLLLCTTGLRARAVAEIQRRDVWDAEAGRVRPSWSVLEKFSQRRHLQPCAELRDAMARYLSTTAAAADGYIFARPLAPPGRPPARSLARAVLETVCRRAGLPRVNPHRFRSYIVHVFLRNRNTLDHAAKFLGHRSASVTFKHYWHPDLEDLTRGVRFLPAAPTSGERPAAVADDGSAASTLSALEWEMQRRRELETENGRLRRRLAVLGEGEGEACPPSPQKDASDGESSSSGTRTTSASSGWTPLDPLAGFG